MDDRTMGDFTHRFRHVVWTATTVVVLGVVMRWVTPSASPEARDVLAQRRPTATPTFHRFDVSCTECPKGVRDRGDWDFSIPVPSGMCGGPLLDVDVALHVKHTWRGDIAVALKAPEWTTRPPVELFRKLGSGTFGTDADDLGSHNLNAFRLEEYLILDDEAPSPVEQGECASPEPSLCMDRLRSTGRTLQREFYGTTANPIQTQADGVWTIRIFDGFAEDNADVRDLKLIISCPWPATATPTSEPATPTATPTDTDVPTAEPTEPPSATPRPTSTRTPTRTPLPTATATRRPLTLYLPVTIRDRYCPPQDVFTDVMLVIDASTTMEIRGADGRRMLDAAVDAARAFVEGFLGQPGSSQVGTERPLREDRAGVIIFNSTARVVQPLTTNKEKLFERLSYIQYTEHQSRVDAGLELAAAELHGEYSPPDHLDAIVLLTDGIVNPSTPEQALAAASMAKGDGVRIFTIGYGEALDKTLLWNISSEGSSSRESYAFVAPSADQLQDILERLRRVVPCPPFLYWPEEEVLP